MSLPGLDTSLVKSDERKSHGQSASDLSKSSHLSPLSSPRSISSTDQENPIEDGNMVTEERKEGESDRERESRFLRMLFTPPEMLLDDGSINQEYFKPTIHHRSKPREWTEEHESLLKSGLETFGVGEWVSIVLHSLPYWDATELILQTSRLLECTPDQVRCGKGYKGPADPLRFRKYLEENGLLLSDDEDAGEEAGGEGLQREEDSEEDGNNTVESELSDVKRRKT